ncbi:MAG: hypothetical protein JAY74_18710 [Candidatus Thiodiazotropha taylori]|nr:hypothetical protein [Candidatus Thiodiazotropha taylori]
MNNDSLATLNKALQFLSLTDEERELFSQALLNAYGKEIREWEIANCMEQMVQAGLRRTGQDGAATITAERYDVSPSTVTRFNAKYFHNSGNLTTDCDGQK